MSIMQCATALANATTAESPPPQILVITSTTAGSSHFFQSGGWLAVRFVADDAATAIGRRQ